MEILEKIIFFLHLIGMASLVGGLLVQIKQKSKIVNRAMLDGAMTQLVTGPILVMLQTKTITDEPINNTVIGIKFLLLLVIITLIVKNRKSKGLDPKVYFSILLFALCTVGLAMFIH